MLAAAPGERLRTLRDLLGLTQARLAKAAGLSQSWISQVENGTRDATDDGLQAIAAATGTPISFFYITPSTVPLDSLRFRKLAGASRTTTNRVHAFFSEGYRVTETLVANERYPTPSLPFATGDELTGGQLEELAAATRVALGLAPDKPIPHLTRALERAGVAVAPIALTGMSGDEHPAAGHFGASFWGGTGATALIGYFPGQQGDRDRFTLAHETGHLVLHTFRPRVPKPQAEIEANKFAAALMMPLSRAVQDLSESLSLNDYARLKATWGVSIQCLIMRGRAVNLIGDTRKNSLFVQLSARGWRKHEPVTVESEAPQLLWRLLCRRYGEKPYVPAADKLAIHPTVLRSIAPTPPSAEQPKQEVAATTGETVVQFRRRT
jgi:Zn-dependent peptidase ImmA (M78 family)/transcriptional regulator with XRE-family HTH domain